MNAAARSAVPWRSFVIIERQCPKFRPKGKFYGTVVRPECCPVWNSLEERMQVTEMLMFQDPIRVSWIRLGTSTSVESL